MVPAISIIIATYNRSDVLRWAIRSVLAQTIQDWELIIVGDACTDNTAAVIASFEEPRIRFVNRSENFGEQSEPNNHGFSLARGDLIAYLNHDDLWFPDHLATLVNCLKRESADLVYALPISVDANGLVFCGVVNTELQYDPSHFVPASLWLARRGLIADLGGWRNSRETFARNPSQDLLFRAWQRTRKIFCSPRVTALFLASGGRPMAYVKRDDSQHRELFQNFADPNFRETLMTRATIRYSSIVDGLQTRGISARLGKIFDRILVMLRQHPDSIRNRLAGRRPGFWIDHLRNVRGLPAKSPPD